MLRLFRFVWSEGKRPDDDADWAGLIAELGVPDADARVAAPEVKAQLRSHTTEAIAHGVFGVPTLLIDDQVFWAWMRPTRGARLPGRRPIVRGGGDAPRRAPSRVPSGQGRRASLGVFLPPAPRGTRRPSRTCVQVQGEQHEPLD
jgi:hypothetical protein